jgi:phage gp36-like protein
MYTTVEQVRIATGFEEATPPAEAKISDGVIEQAIKEADGIINGKINDVYILPLSSVPSLIEMISTQLAKGILYAQEYGEETENLDKGWQKTMDYYLGLLDDIRDRKLKLIDENGQNLPTSSLFRMSGLPNAQTNQDKHNPTNPKFRINEVF